MRVPKRSTSTISTVLGAALLLSGCAQLGGDAGTGLAGLGNGGIAATGGGAEVLVTDLQRELDAVLAGAPFIGLSEMDVAGQTLDIQTQILTSLLQVAMVEQAAEDQFGLVITDEDIDAAVALAVEAAGGQDAFEEQLALQEQTMDSVRQQTRINLLIQGIQEGLTTDQPLTDADVDAAFEEARGDFEQVSAKHILVATQAEAVDVLARLQAGEPFADLAADLSMDPGSGANGGALGAAPRGTFVPEFEAAIWDGPATPGELLGPIETQFGFHIIVVDEFIVTPEDEARQLVLEQLEATRGNDLFGGWISQTFSDADPMVASRFGVWDRNQQIVVAPHATDEPAA